MGDLPPELAVLTAMITPAVLLSSCATLIIATTSRLNRAVDRTRELLRRFTDMQKAEPAGADDPAESRMIFVLLEYSSRRSRLLQRALAGLYYSVCAFVATSVAIAFAALSDRGFAIPISLGVSASGLLLYASLVLVHESRVSLSALRAELDYVSAQRQASASEELLALPKRRRMMKLR